MRILYTIIMKEELIMYVLATYTTTCAAGMAMVYKLLVCKISNAPIECSH